MRGSKPFAEPKFTENIKGKVVKEYIHIDVGDGEYWPGLLFTDGSVLVIQRDPEGNGGGFMSLEDGQGKTIGSAGCD